MSVRNITSGVSVAGRGHPTLFRPKQLKVGIYAIIIIIQKESEQMNILGFVILIIVIGLALYYDNKNGEPGKPDKS